MTVNTPPSDHAIDPPSASGQTTPRYSELTDFIKQHALQRGQFTLASGKQSTFYLDGKKVTLSPQGAFLVAEAILQEIKRLGVEADAIGGMDMGGTMVAGSLAVRIFQTQTPIATTFVVRKQAKSHGTMKKIEGPLNPPCRVILVEDVVTSGGSIIQAVEAVRELGCQVVLVISIIDRQAGGAQRLQDVGVRYSPLVCLTDLGVNPS